MFCKAPKFGHKNSKKHLSRQLESLSFFILYVLLLVTVENWNLKKGLNQGQNVNKEAEILQNKKQNHLAVRGR